MVIVLIGILAGSNVRGYGLGDDPVYILRKSLVFHNLLSRPAVLNISNNSLHLYLVPTIGGWQELLSYAVFKDGQNITGDFVVLRDIDDNLLLSPQTEEVIEIPPGGSINITLVQHVKVYRGGFFSHRTRRKLPPESPPLGAAPPDAFGRYLLLNGFWNYTHGAYNSKLIEEVSEVLSSNASTQRDYLLAAARWILSNVRYKLPFQGGIIPPSMTLVRKEGACGEFSTLLISLLRVRNIPSFMYLAVYYDPSLHLNITADGVEYHADNAVQHAFVMALIGDEWVPVDLTLPRRSPEEAAKCVDEAGINISDKIIVTIRVVNKNPNEYLLIGTPVKGLKLKYYTSLEVVKEIKEPNIVLIAALLALIVAAIVAYWTASNRY